jgi:nucleotide-binding universal stress UspA family protein
VLVAPSSIQRILVAVDRSSCSRAALEFACSLAHTRGARLEVLFVHPSSTAIAAPPAVQGTPEREELRAFVASVPGSAGLAVSERDPRQRIVALAEAGAGSHNERAKYPAVRVRRAAGAGRPARER